MLVKSVIKDFERDGFYVAKGLIDVNAISDLLENIKSSFDNVLNYYGIESGDNYEESMTKLFNYDSEKYKILCGSLWRKLKVFDLLHDVSIRSFIYKNFGWSDIFLPGGQVVHIMDKRLVPPDGYHGISTHQDWPSVMGSLDGMVVWIPLMDIDKNLYPLEVIPGSHDKGMLALSNDPQKPWELDEHSYDSSRFIPVEVEKGDVVFMSYFCIHRSSLNGNGLRLACSTRYDNANEQNFIARVYPTAYTRGVNRYLGDLSKN